MKDFSLILHQAEQRKGGRGALNKLLAPVLPDEQLLQKHNDYFFEILVKVVNQAGFRWSVIDKKWPQFKEAYFGFNVAKLTMLSPEQWESYMSDTRIVRNWQKIKAAMENAAFVYQESCQRGSFSHLLVEWPKDDQIGLMAYLKKHGSRLGGNTGQRFLRYAGKDTFILTKDVVLALQTAGLDIANEPNTKRDLVKVQNLLNVWHKETGIPYSHLSQILAFSTGINYENEEINS